jgi:hypothetical protein
VEIPEGGENIFGSPIAGLISIERLAPGSAKALSMLILIKAIPEIRFSSV